MRRNKLAVISLISGAAAAAIGVLGNLLGTLAIVAVLASTSQASGWAAVPLIGGDIGALMLGVVGVIAGVVALIQIRLSSGITGGSSMAIAGISTGATVLCLGGFFFLLALAMGGS